MIGIGGGRARLAEREGEVGRAVAHRMLASVGLGSTLRVWDLSPLLDEDEEDDEEEGKDLATTSAVPNSTDEVLSYPRFQYMKYWHQPPVSVPCEAFGGSILVNMMVSTTMMVMVTMRCNAMTEIAK